MAKQRKEIGEFREEIATTVRALKTETKTWSDGAKQEIADMVTTQRNGFEADQGDRGTQFHSAMAQWKEQMAAELAAYQEQMRLKEPAQYWENLERDYKKQGRLWTVVSLGVALGIAAMVWNIVYEPPEILTDESSPVEGIKGAILITVAVSVMIFFMNFCVRIATSAYHLARDARERLQLTHVFLALIKEKAIDPKDRDIVLTSLFSRSDTGLLKHDSGPSFPTPLSTIIQNLGRHK